MSERRLFSLEEVAYHAGVEEPYVQRLVEVGIIDPDPTEPSRFHPHVTVRIRQVVRLDRDLGVNPEGAAVILELLDRIEALERRLR